MGITDKIMFLIEPCETWDNLGGPILYSYDSESSVSIFMELVPWLLLTSLRGHSNIRWHLFWEFWDPPPSDTF